MIPFHKGVIREGCEVWSRSWGSFRRSHYQQEYGGTAQFTVEESSSMIHVKVESVLGRHVAPHHRRGWCINNWLFQRNTPLISCDFTIGGGKHPLTLFKKYVCFRPRFYSYWAYNEGSEVTAGCTRNVTDKTPSPVSPPPAWVTLFNKNQGFAVIMPEAESEQYYAKIWRSNRMAEIVYGCFSKKETVSSSINYVLYPTSPHLKWKALEEYL